MEAEPEMKKSLESLLKVDNGDDEDTLSTFGLLAAGQAVLCAIGSWDDNGSVVCLLCLSSPPSSLFMYRRDERVKQPIVSLRMFEHTVEHLLIGGKRHLPVVFRCNL